MNDYISEIIMVIKQKKELRSLKEFIVREEIDKVLQQNTKLRKELASFEGKNLLRSSAAKQVMKTVRASLHKVYGVFQTDPLFREVLLEKLTHSVPGSVEFLQIHRELLRTHKSTNERLDIYDYVYQKIFAITGNPKTLLDLGCGLNPCSFPWMKLSKVHYMASELSPDDCAFLEKYFQIMKISCFAIPIDLRQCLKKNDVFAKIPLANVCFLWKVLESIELRSNHRLSEAVLKAIPARWVVVSFSTTTLSGKQMNTPRRPWFELMVKRLNYSVEILKEPGEVFYLVNKPMMSTDL